MALILQPSHPASLDITLPCDTEYPLLWCPSSHEILPPLPAPLSELRPASNNSFWYGVFIQEHLRVWILNLFRHWAKSPEVLEENGGRLGYVFNCIKSCLHTHMSTSRPVSCLLSTLLCCGLSWSQTWSAEPAPSIPSAYLLPSDYLLLSDLYMGLVNAHTNGQGYRSL